MTARPAGYRLVTALSRRGRRVATLLAASALVACGGRSPVDSGADEEITGREGRVPLSELGTDMYLGYEGGLYPGGGSLPPAAHAAAGMAAARLIQPLNASGAPDPSGRIVVLSIGMSNTTQEFCSGPVASCAPRSFVGQALADPRFDRARVVLVDGARGGQTAGTWDSPSDDNYQLVKTSRLAPLGVTDRQVQVAWVKVANAMPRDSLPSPGADALTLLRQMGDVARTLKVHFPNLRQVYFSSRIYGGYATTALNPEPYAYQSGFAVKWLVEAQIRQMTPGGAPDARAGDLDHRTIAPWIAWGPYLWADGTHPRPDDELVWRRTDLAADGTHPSAGGVEKVGGLLLDFFTTTPQTRCWFLTGEQC